MSDLKRPQWRERLLASASASTIKIAGVGKKLRNKVILLRDVFIPPCIKATHTQSGHGWESQFTAPPPPRKPEVTYQSLSPIAKHDSSVSQRIICVKDLNPALFGDQSPDSDWSGDEKDEVRSFMSGHHRPGKPLSTLPEEDDDELEEEDMYVDALVMPIEELRSIPDIANTFGSPDRSRVSPPWMHAQLTSDGSSTLTSLGANAVSRNMDALNVRNHREGRPSFASTFDYSGFSTKSPVALSFMSGEGQSPARTVSVLSAASSFGRRPASANLSVCDSTTTTTNGGGRRRSASLVMLPDRNRKRGASVTSTISGRGKENAGQQEAIGDIADGSDDDDDEDDGEAQSYYVYEASSLAASSDSDHGGRGGGRGSVLILMPVPEDEQRRIRQREAAEEENGWGSADDDVTPRSSIWGTAPLAPSPPLRAYPPPPTEPSLLTASRPTRRLEEERPHEAPATVSPVVVSWTSKSKPTTQAAATTPTPVPSPSLTPKTLSAPPPPRRTNNGLGGSVPLPRKPHPQSHPHPQVKRSRSSRSGDPLTRVRSTSTRASTPPPPPPPHAKTPATPHVKLSSSSNEASRTIPPPTTHAKRQHAASTHQRLPTPTTTAPPSHSHSHPRKDRSAHSRADSQRASSEEGGRLMAEKNDEFIRSSGRAFQGQSFRAIQVLDEYSGAMEVHVGKGVKAKADHRDNRSGGVRSSLSAPSFSSPDGSSSKRHSVRPRPSM